MASGGTVQRPGGRPHTDARDSIPSEVGEAVERRLAELRPLYEEYTQLLCYRRLISAPVRAADGDARSRRSSRATTGVARAAILDALAEDPKTSTELAVELSVTPATLRYNLRRLVRTGLIVESRSGETVSYTLANQGPDGG